MSKEDRPLVNALSEDDSPLHWVEGKGVAIQDFLKEYPPSKQTGVIYRDDGTAVVTPWIWLHLPSKQPAVWGKDVDEKSMLESGRDVIEETTAEMKRIKDDDKIPVRASKAKPRNKKIAREEAENKVRESLKDLAIKHDCRSGKWLFYGTEESIDRQWSKIATSLGTGDGALRTKTKFCTAKVSTTGSPRDEGGPAMYVICVYIPDSFDKEAAYEACTVLIKDLLMAPNSFKPDIYTLLGINSNNAMGIKSTLYSTNDVMPKKDRDEYFESQSKKAKPKAKKATDDDDGGFDDTDSDDDDAGPAKKKTKV